MSRVRAVHGLLLRPELHVVEARRRARRLDRRDGEEAHAPRLLAAAQAGDPDLHPRRRALRRRALHPRRRLEDERRALRCARKQLGDADADRRGLGGRVPVGPRLRAPVGEALVRHDARQPRRAVGELDAGLHPRALVDQDHDASLIELGPRLEREGRGERRLHVGRYRPQQRLRVVLDEQRLVERLAPVVEVWRRSDRQRIRTVTLEGVLGHTVVPCELVEGGDRGG
mmetsp:Transcript_17484/g.51705  ORF Transcript_17484/g.51705 Transcript_17484/m.51705 type:complete len:228 (+) Transcript_17484:71-754(+)